MNLDAIEILLVDKLKRLFRKQADVLPGPVANLALGGMQETVFVHAQRFEDHDGVTPEGATIARRPVRNGRISGMAEERPGLIIVEITCIATAYHRVKILSGEITPAVLLALSCEREFELGSSANRQSTLKFADFQPSLNQVETVRSEDDHLVFHLERLRFHLIGALHVELTKYGGLKARKSRQKKPPKKTRGKAGKKSVKKSRSKKR